MRHVRWAGGDVRLFVRDTSGTRPTAAGERFVKYASALVAAWEEARTQLSLPPGRERAARIGGEPSLWSPLLVDWLLWMNRHHAQVAVRAEVDVAERLLDRVEEGSLDLAVVYGPPQRPNLVVELMADEKLVMVTTDPAGAWDPATYVHVDWGASFTANSRAAFPHLGTPTTSVSLGPLALSYLEQAGGSGYFRSSVVSAAIAAGRLTKVPAAPEFSHSVYAVYPARDIGGVVDRMRAGLKACLARQADNARR